MHVIKLLLKIAGWFLVVSSIICLLISLFAYLHAHSFTRSAVRAQGTVTKVEKRKDHDGDELYYPIVSFRDAHGGAQELFSSVGSFPPSHRVGDSVTVLYPPEQPQKAKLDEFFAVWGLAAITGGIGAFDLIVGLAMLLVPVIIRRFRHAPAPPVLNAA